MAAWIIVFFFALFAYIAQFELEQFRNDVRTSTSINLGEPQQVQPQQNQAQQDQLQESAPETVELKMGTKDAGLAEQLYIDKWIGTKGIFVTIFTLLGVIGGGVTVYRQIMEVIETKDSDRENRGNGFR